jgi:hypothetical protein
MTGVEPDHDDIVALTALANGIIPPDGRDSGAAVVGAGVTLGEKIRRGVNAALYSQGLKVSDAMSREKYGLAVGQLNPSQVHELLGALRDTSPAFFKQLRMDVSALYLSDPGVWQRIGFPGPSTASGGYPDFDQPQLRKITRLKEAAS